MFYFSYAVAWVATSLIMSCLCLTLPYVAIDGLPIAT